MINTVIIEDEKNSRELLQRLLEDKFPEIVTRGTADNIEDGYSLIQSVAPQLVFLDIEMRKATAFDLLNRFHSVPFEIIFYHCLREICIKSD
jgi:two-component system LytT family response regulator